MCVRRASIEGKRGRPRVSAIALLGLILFPLSTIFAQVTARVPDMSVIQGSRIAVPLKISSLGVEKVTAFEFIVTCDTSMLVLEGVDQRGTLTEGLTMFANNRVAPYGRGRMKVVCASAHPIAGGGVLVNILATVLKKPGQTPLKLSGFVLNAGRPAVEPRDGMLVIRRSAPETTRQKSKTSLRN